MSRRAFLVSVSLTAGALSLGFGDRPVHASASPDYAPFTRAGPEVTAWIVIMPDETVVIRVARSEMGQGTFTTLPMLVAEELECDWSRVRAEYAPPSEGHKRNIAWRAKSRLGAHPAHHRIATWGLMSTEGSRGVSDSHLYLRQAGAMARIMLVEAAAKEWNVPTSECTAAAGRVTHVPTGRKLSYGKLAAAASAIPPPTSVRLKDPKNWRLCGKPVRHITTPAKVDGSLAYAIDVRLPDMLYATITQCPVFGGRIKTFDDGAVKSMPGVHKVVALDRQTICVIAESFWQAKTALDALPIEWDEGPNASLTSETIAQFQREGFASLDAAIANSAGDALSAIDEATRKVEAEYDTPYLDHAALEPMNCTARLRGSAVEVWVASQNAEAALSTAAEAAGVRPENVYVHKMHLGGGFGRRTIYNDPIRFAVLAANRTKGRPVKLLYTREEDMGHGFYRPASRIVLRGGIDEKGNVMGLHVRIAGQSINAQHYPAYVKDNYDPAQAAGFTREDLAYAFPNVRIDVVMRNPPVPVGVWRSVNYSQNTFYKESFVDELAHAAGKDPVEFRRGLLANAPKLRRVLEIAAERSGWGKPLPAARFRGIAVEQAFGSYQAIVAEVSVSESGKLAVHRIVSAIDCGHAINPNIIEQQLQGAVAMAMTATLYGENRIDKGRIIDTNFDTYRLIRIDEMPAVETHIVPSRDFWGGVGESGLPPVAPAICNAIYAATRIRVRSLPLKHHDLRRA
jgi:isoquinoline 1-oxidoreductase beta subunit